MPSLILPNVMALQPRLQALIEVLELGDRQRTEDLCQAFVMDIARVLNVPPVKVYVYEKRPSNARGELHGLYQRNPEWRYPRISLWMRTATQMKVVAPKTFLRTLLHEVLHHLDYTYFRFSHSRHTRDFYRRESSLLKQLMV